MAVDGHYEVLVLGSGEAGKYTAWTMAKSGHRAAVIERGLIGGSCPNVACLPSKNIIHSAKVASLFRRSHEFGIAAPGWSLDMSGVLRRKQDMVNDLIKVHLDRYRSSGAELILGEGRFVGPKTLEVELKAGGGVRIVTGDRIFLNTGTRAAIPSMPELEALKPLTHVEALDLDRVPQHLIVLGAGFVGLEIAQAMRRFGSEVTVVDRNQHLAHREDADVSAALAELFADEGISAILGAQATAAEGVSGQKVRLQLRTESGGRAIEGSDLLVAAGRVPNTQGIGLELAGVATDERGYIKVNERLETTAPGVWAMGDCAGSPHFTHIAFDDFRIVRDNLAGGSRSTRDRLTPFCMFTDPEYARVGLNEREAASRGIAYRVAKIPMAAVLRTRTLSEKRGFMKALLDSQTDRILGFTAFGVGAGEIMAIAQIAISAGLPYTSLRDAVLTHPTLAEGFTVLFADVPRREDAKQPGIAQATHA